MHTCNTVGDVIKNRLGLYDGDLKHYFKVVFEKARNLTHPYHNFRHVFHVTFNAHRAIEYYGNESISKQNARALLIAAMFHDYDHTGRTGNDDLNIQYALRGLRANILEEDKHLLPEIEFDITATEWPPKTARELLPLPAAILCDSDVSQALSVAWIQQVVFGLAQEMNKTPREILGFQETFLKSLTFVTEWAKKTFTQEAIQAKIDEAKDLLDCLQ